MNKEFEIDKWRIQPKRPLNEDLDESYVEMVFRLKSDIQGFRGIKKEDLIELESDLKDLCKWRQFRELKKYLEK